MVLGARTLDGDDGLVARVRRAGGDEVLESVDVRDPRAQEALSRRAVEEWGQVDFLLANAGIADRFA
jgi:NADP-dependent 3-hydroxy acid dehydrogenase YdfG